ncbi:MAG TPA: LysR substrate-binding domain-containing protein [Streptosporangiaceae bacterium]|nr:LysR substrate-binding domain-containing protein [Streptosporangiaceae bacterium]
MTTDARLRTFVAVADTGSVHAAAGRLMVTDSAVSAALAALTREVGAPLLERQGRGLRLTPSGRTYAAYARTILGLHEEALAAARGDADPEHGRVRAAAVTTAAEHILPPVLASFRDRHPGVDLGLEVGASDRVWGLLAERGADLVIAGRPPRRLDVAVRAVRPNHLVVVGRPGIAAAAGVLRTTWLMREAGSGTRAACEALLAALDADPSTLTLGSNGAVIAGAVAGLGVTLVSRDAVAGPLASGHLVELPVPQTPMSRPWHAVTWPRASAVAELFVAHLLTRDSPAGARWRQPRRDRSVRPGGLATGPSGDTHRMGPFHGPGDPGPCD